MVTYFADQKKKEPVDSTHAHLLILPQTTDPLPEVERFVVENLGWTQSFEHPDVHVLNPDLKPIAIEQVRDLQPQLAYQSYGAEGQLFILLGIDTASIPAQNALLKTLEEPPAGTTLILTARSTTGVVGTILSRCVAHTSLPDQTNHQQTEQQVELSQAASQLYHQIETSSYGDLISLAEKHTDREQGIALITALLQLVHQKMSDQPSPILQKQLVAIQQTLTHLQQNLNVRLCIESCLFAIKKSRF